MPEVTACYIPTAAILDWGSSDADRYRLLEVPRRDRAERGQRRKAGRGVVTGGDGPRRMS